MVSPLSFLRIPTLYIPLLWIYQINIPFALRMSNRLVAPLHLKGMLLDDEAIKVLEMLKHLLHHPLMLLLLQLLLSLPLAPQPERIVPRRPASRGRGQQTRVPSLNLPSRSSSHTGRGQTTQYADYVHS